jgi:hypothetical protein
MGAPLFPITRGSTDEKTGAARGSLEPGSEHVNDTDVIWIDIEADPHRAVILLDWDVRACHDVCRGAGGGAGGLAKAG